MRYDMLIKYNNEIERLFNHILVVWICLAFYSDLSGKPKSSLTLRHFFFLHSVHCISKLHRVVHRLYVINSAGTRRVSF
jgi:hypothetical protein